jgi:hypothetical protein
VYYAVNLRSQGVAVVVRQGLFRDDLDCHAQRVEQAQEDDYNAQKDFVNELCAFAQAHQVHIHLVHHVRKGESEMSAPGKLDIKGAGAITDMVDNVFIVWRNKKAEREGKGEPTCIVACVKQRNGEYEGKFGFWFDLESQQYFEAAREVASRYDLGNPNRKEAAGTGMGSIPQNLNGSRGGPP